MSRKETGRAWRIVFWSMLLAGFLSVTARCWYLQHYQWQASRKRAIRQQLRIISQQPRRGLIMDRKGVVLAVSITEPSVWCDPKIIGEKHDVAYALAPILHLDGDELSRKIQSRPDRRFMWIKRYITEEQAELIRKLDVRGLGITYEFRRKYPMQQLACHVIGYTDIDGRGLEGVEAVYEKYLAGHPGRMELLSDVYRRPVVSYRTGAICEDGNSLVLTIDAVIQSFVEDELRQTVRKFHAASATAIVMDPGNGEILALANWPAFDLSKAGQAPPASKRNRALTDPYEPGSTFKPFTVGAAIEGGFVRISQKIDCLQHPYVGKGFGRIREYKHYFGILSVADCLVRSSNIGTAKLAQKMGKKYFRSMLGKFGFGRKTGIDLLGEAACPIRPWNDKLYTSSRVGFGQGISVTPIQLIRGFCCLVNGGRLIKPHVVRAVVGPQGEIIRDFTRGDINFGQEVMADDRGASAAHVLSEKVSREIIEKALVGVVASKHGTAHRAALEDWQIFGKTGTAQIAHNGHYVEGKYVSSFIAGAPAENPRICVLVLVREPDRSLGLGYTGGAVAAPAVKNILQQSLAYLGVPKRAKTGTKLATNQ